VPPAELDRVERTLLIHLLVHHGQQVRFEASQWVTEFGIVRQFSNETPDAIRRALHALEMGRLIYRRTQYVVGYSEPKHVYSLTPSGHRKAIEVREESETGNGPEAPSERTPDGGSTPAPRDLHEDDRPEPPEGTEPTA
jgi:hypothetical protein